MLGWNANIVFEIPQDEALLYKSAFRKISCELSLSSEHPLLLTSATGTEYLTLTCPVSLKTEVAQVH